MHRSSETSATRQDAPASRDLPRRVLDNLLEGCQVIGPDYRYLYVNDAVVRHGRTTRDALLGRTMMEAYPGIDRTPMFAVLRRCMNEGRPERMENEFAFPDGSTGWFELHFEPVPEGVAILSVDITDRKRAEAALRRTMRALTTLSRCNHTLVRAVDERQFLHDVCRLVVESAGYRSAWIGLLDPADPQVLVPAASAGFAGGDAAARRLAEAPWCRTLVGRALETREAAVAPAGDAAAAPRGVAACVALPLGRGAARYGALVICAAEPEAFDDDERALLSEVAMDLGYGIETLRARAEQRRTAEQLVAAQRLEAVGRLAGGVAHDFNNLLSVILTYAGFVTDQLHPSDPSRADVAQIHEAGRRAAALTRQLLAFSRKQVLEPQVVSLNRVIAGIENMLRRLLGEDVDVAVRAAPDLGNVLADPGQLEQVIMNLAVNARDAMPQGGRLTIETANVELDDAYAAEHIAVQPGPYVRLAVADTGTGMSAETRQRVFEPFFTTKEKGKGTGLGLSTVYGIVKQSGGNIWVYSEPEHGTTFKIYLPRVDAPAVEPRRAAPTPPATGHETILLVEDEAAVRTAAERILRGAGYRVLPAANAGEALLLCERREEPIHLVLTDVVMPRMSGRELADRLAQLSPGLKVLFTSGYTDDAIVRHGVLQPGTRFIGKPFTVGELTRKVREVLDEG